MHAVDAYRGVFAHAVNPLLEAADVAMVKGAERSDVSLYAAAFLVGRGISASLITKINQGGIDRFNPGEANRHCKIELFLTAR